MTDIPSETDWVRACAGIIGVKCHYEDIGATKSAMEIIDLIERCLRHGADVVHTSPPDSINIQHSTGGRRDG